MIRDAYIQDIHITEAFADDLDAAPPNVKRKFYKLVDMMLEHGKFPKSMNVHQAAAVDDEIWIGYVTRTKAHWRVLFEEQDDEVFFLRLLKHEKTNVAFKTGV